MYSKELEKVIKGASRETFTISFGMNGIDFKAFQRAVNIGIDSYLEAVDFTCDVDSRGCPLYSISPDTLHVLVRRLLTADYCSDQSLDHDDEGCDGCELSSASWSLGSCICEVLGVDVV